MKKQTTIEKLEKEVIELKTEAFRLVLQIGLTISIIILILHFVDILLGREVMYLALLVILFLNLGTILKRKKK